MSKESTDLCYPILTPFKSQGVVVKPPAFIQLSEEEAEPLTADGLIGGDAALSIEEAAAASIEMAQTQNPMPTTEANPASGAPLAGKAKPARVVRKTAARNSKA